ncbi:hypothetical protein JOQ06_001855 [Pogonophryne albipinna]|uniref:Uncharacterized protein n=1 Tax=Pogonophryne albipinna TaxID=1090488 RepID=A0AAD6B3I2_9TELE|nr:hypothetical protein JOQ06_001855 [Pogonophryne albipinna]
MNVLFHLRNVTETKKTTTNECTKCCKKIKNKNKDLHNTYIETQYNKAIQNDNKESLSALGAEPKALDAIFIMCTSSGGDDDSGPTV